MLRLWSPECEDIRRRKEIEGFKENILFLKQILSKTAENISLEKDEDDAKTTFWNWTKENKWRNFLCFSHFV